MVMATAADDTLTEAGARDEHRLTELRAHVLWLQNLATMTMACRPRRIHRGELVAWADAARDLYNEVLRLRVLSRTAQRRQAMVARRASTLTGERV
jgi:hypothetical protein